MAYEMMQYYEQSNCNGNVVSAFFDQLPSGSSCNVASSCTHVAIGDGKPTCPSAIFPSGIDSYMSNLLSSQNLGGGTSYVAATYWNDTSCTTTPSGFMYVVLDHCLSLNLFSDNYGNSSILTYVNGVAQIKIFSDMNCQNYYSTYMNPDDQFGIEGQCSNGTTYRMLMIANNYNLQSSRTTIIVASVVGAIATFSLIAGSFYWFYIRRMQKKRIDSIPEQNSEDPANEVPVNLNPPPPDYQLIANQIGESDQFSNRAQYSYDVGRFENIQVLVGEVQPDKHIEKYSLMDVFSLSEKPGLMDVLFTSSTIQENRNKSSSEFLQNFGSLQSSLTKLRTELLETKVSPDPLQWNMEDVSRWVLKNGGNTSDIQNAIREQEVNGQKLLGLLSEKDVSDVLKVKEDVICINIWNRVRELKILVEFNENGSSSSQGSS